MQLLFERQDTVGMRKLLMELHEKTSQPETPSEIAFVQSYGNELEDARRWLVRYDETNHMQDLINAWNIYHRVYRSINKTVPQISEVRRREEKRRKKRRTR